MQNTPRSKQIFAAVNAICIFATSFLFVVHASAQPDGKALVQAAIVAMGGEKNLRTFKSMQMEGVAHQYFLEQSERPEGPWLVDYQEFSELRDLHAGKIKRTTKSRNILSPTAMTISRLVEGGAAAMEFNGRSFPAFPFEAQETEEMLALMPERALLLALDATNLRLEKDTPLQGVNHHVVTFSWQDKPFRIFLNAHTALPTATELVSDHPYDVFWGIWGDVATRIYFSTWMIESGGIRYPRQFDFVRNDLPWKSLTATTLTLNPPLSTDSLNISPDIKTAFEKSKTDINNFPLGWRARGQATELAKDIVKILAGWDVALVRQSDGVVIIEAPISSGYSAQIIAEAERRYPNVPIKAVISTSDAWPHIGGIREYAARGIPIYAVDLNRPVLERLIAAPYRSHPDALAKAPRQPKFQIVKEKVLLGTGANRLELYPIRGEGSERMMMVYFPEHGLLYGSDLIQRLRDGSFFMPQYLSELADAVAREKLAVKTVFAMHAEATPWSEITSAIAKAMVPSANAEK